MQNQKHDALLRESARLAVEVQHIQAVAKTRDPEARYFVYCLLLQNDPETGMPRVYVGNTDNIYTRLLSHFTMSSSSSMCVKQWGPVRSVLEICRNCDKDDETHKVYEWMSMLGWLNVRGAAFCKPLLEKAPTGLADYKKAPQGRVWNNLSRAEIDNVWSYVSELSVAAPQQQK
jgi:hypothetical protein